MDTGQRQARRPRRVALRSAAARSVSAELAGAAHKVTPQE
jgi:hypothetical protein